jgi:succinate dehydrogenase hydrophobic anchor subunit
MKSSKIFGGFIFLYYLCINKEQQTTTIMNRIILTIALTITLLTLTIFCNEYLNVAIFIFAFLLWVLGLTNVSEDKNKTQGEKKILDAMNSVFEE